MSQKRLNPFMICAIYSERLDDVDELAKEFALRNTKSENMFLMPT